MTGARIIFHSNTVCLNLVVPSMSKLEMDWFHCTSFKKSSGSMEPLEPLLTPALKHMHHTKSTILLKTKTNDQNCFMKVAVHLLLKNCK